MKTTTDKLFELGLIIKGVDAIFEIMGGLLLLTPIRVSGWLAVISQHSKHELTAHLWQNVADKVALASIATALYLLVHGMAKVVLIAAVFKDKKWGYVGLMGVLSFFAVFELFKAASKHESLVLALCFFDALIVFLIAKEYQKKYLAVISP